MTILSTDSSVDPCDTDTCDCDCKLCHDSSYLPSPAWGSRGAMSDVVSCPRCCPGGDGQ